VRRALGLIAVLLAAIVIVGSGPTAGAATTCVKHTKRVVKHVKRHGKSRRVVRVKHYTTCHEVATAEPAPVTTTPAPAPVPAPTPAPTPTPQPEPEPNALGIAAEDSGGMRYTLSRDKVRPGALTIQLNDRGEDPHAMAMEKLDSEGKPDGTVIVKMTTEPGAQETKTVDLEPGRYRMYCTIGHHAENGMEAVLEVE
jgi:hypothetical protein